MRLLTGIAIAIVFVACSGKKKFELKTGTWRGALMIQGEELPFNFEVFNDSSNTFKVLVKNAEEELMLDEVTVKADSVIIRMHVFDSELRAKIDNDSLNGYFIKNYEKDYRIPFKAAFNQNFRFAKNAPSSTRNFTGKYQVIFTNEADTTAAVGIFKQQESHATGTFLTTTGDYRYLEGEVINDELFLSTFDGNHAYLFKAIHKNDSTLQGEYWSGKTWRQTWVGIKNENVSLPPADSLTKLRTGFDRVSISFPNLNGDTLSLNDAKYKNKVVILQLFGTWCPNCMDETKFLAPWYEKNKHRGVEIIGLAYERKPDFTYASERVKKMLAKWHVTYDFVIAGTNDKKLASQTLPMLSGVMAFPTTIFIGKDGKVKKIHTGFSGPGTGVYYEQFVEEFNEIINRLLSEETNTTL